MAINQVIYCVREGPFSIEFMTCCKKQMLQRYWKFAGYIIICRERATVKAEGQCFIMIPLPVDMSRWGDPIGRRRGFDRIRITPVFSLVIILHGSCSGGVIPPKQRERLSLFGIFFLAKKKRKRKDKTGSNFFYNWLFFFNKKQQLSLWLQSLYQPDIEVFFVRLTAAFPEMPSFFPCSNNVLMDSGWMSVGGSSERNQRVGAGLDFVHSSWRSGWSMRGSAVSYREHIYSCFKERFVSLNLLALSVSASARRAGTATT